MGRLQIGLLCVGRGATGNMRFGRKHTLPAVDKSLQSRSLVTKSWLVGEPPSPFSLAGRGVAQPGLARHLGVVEVARSNRVAPIFWPEGQKIERRKESSRTGELFRGNDYPTRYIGGSVSLLSFLLGLLSPALLSRFRGTSFISEVGRFLGQCVS